MATKEAKAVTVSMGTVTGTWAVTTHPQKQGRAVMLTSDPSAD